MNNILGVGITVLASLIACYQLYKAEVKQKTRLLIALIIFLVVSAYFSYLLTYPWDSLKTMEAKYKNAQEELSKHASNSESNASINVENVLSDSLVLPKRIRLRSYEEKRAILDKTLFIGRHYNEFIIGGKNLDLLKLAARTDKGENLDLRRNPLSNFVVAEYWLNPYFEIQYKGKYFSIEVTVNNFDPICTVNEIRLPTMALKTV